MVPAHLSNDEFFTRLAELFNPYRERGHGSIFLTQKRLSHSDEPDTPIKVADDPLWDLNHPNPLPIIIRATNGKSKERRKEKIKLSTIVQPETLDAFYTKYADVCKGGMQALKKRDRSKRKKDKAKKRKVGG